MKSSKEDIICRKNLDYPEGALLGDGYDDAGQLLAHPLGGGFQLTVPAEEACQFRVVEHGETGAALFSRRRFSLVEGCWLSVEWEAGAAGLGGGKSEARKPQSEGWRGLFPHGRGLRRAN